MNKLFFLFLILIVIILGLGSRRYSHYLPWIISRYAGDVLWALMVFLIIRLIFFEHSTEWVSLRALLMSFLIEISQLYHSNWIDTIRATKLGGLVLGFGFLWSDLVCYTIGVFFGVLLDKIVKHTQSDGSSVR